MGEEQEKKVDGGTFRLFFLTVIHHKLHERRVMVKLSTLSVSYMLAEGEMAQQRSRTVLRAASPS